MPNLTIFHLYSMRILSLVFINELPICHFVKELKVLFNFIYLVLEFKKKTDK